MDQIEMLQFIQQRLGFSQKEMARFIFGVRPNTIGNYMKGKSMPEEAERVLIGMCDQLHDETLNPSKIANEIRKLEDPTLVRAYYVLIYTKLPENHCKVFGSMEGPIAEFFGSYIIGSNVFREMYSDTGTDIDFIIEDHFRKAYSEEIGKTEGVEFQEFLDEISRMCQPTLEKLERLEEIQYEKIDEKHAPQIDKIQSKIESLKADTKREFNKKKEKAIISRISLFIDEIKDEYLEISTEEGKEKDKEND